MAFRTKKISQMDPKGSNLASTDLLEISQLVSGSYVTKSITGAQIAASAPAAAWGTITGTLSSQTDLNTALSGKVPTTRTLTINGTTQDLSANRTFTISTGITIGTTAITSGTVGRVLFEGTGNVVQESANLFWDNTNGRLGIGTSTPTNTLHIYTSVANYGLRLQSNATGANLIGTEYLWDTTQLGTFSVNGNSGEFKWFMKSGGFFPTIYSNGVERLRIATTGNLLINTTTDAGFKLDVNGTARVQGVLSALTSSTNGIVLRNDLGTNSQIDWVAGVTRISLQRTSGDGLNILTSAGTFTMYTRSDGTLIGGSSLGDLQASAQLQVQSTTKGFLPPRMTTTQKNAIATPATGLMVYDNVLNRPCFYDGATWITL
jgi:hypothetical protein